MKFSVNNNTIKVKGRDIMTDKTGADGDTVKLLRECDSGIKMGISAIDDVINDVQNYDFKTLLSDSKSQHQKLQEEIDMLLIKHADDGKEPSPMAKSMSKMKTNMKMAFDGSDNTIADLITDGCNMGVKSLSRYLNQYQSADSKSKNIASRLVDIEDRLSVDVRQFL